MSDPDEKPPDVDQAPGPDNWNEPWPLHDTPGAVEPGPPPPPPGDDKG
jgi:hypothetical protein